MSTAINLLTTCVQTAWNAKPCSVVSILSLDIVGAFDVVGAFDNVGHSCLEGILRRKSLLEWMVRMVARFTRNRRTRIAYLGYESD